MKPSYEHAAHFLTVLEEMNTVGLTEAKRRFAEAAAQVPEIGAKLVWERSYTGYHYEILLGGRTGTVSLSICPHQHAPWAMRNATHPREGDFAVINDHVVSVATGRYCISQRLVCLELQR